jgi:hypothetical protein
MALDNEMEWRRKKYNDGMVPCSMEYCRLNINERIITVGR